MRKLVDEKSKTSNSRFAIESIFVAYKLVVYTCAINLLAVVFCLASYVCSLWPYGIVGSTHALTVASIDDVNKVYVAIIVAVIEREVDRIFHKLASINNHLGCSLVVARRACSTIVCHILRQSDRTNDVELRSELSVAHLTKILANATIVFALSISKFLLFSLFFIKILVERALRVFDREFLVLIFCQYHQSLRTASMWKYSLRRTLYRFSSHYVSSTYLFSLCKEILLRFCDRSKGVANAVEYCSIERCIPAEVFVAMLKNCYGCTIRLCDSYWHVPCLCSPCRSHGESHCQCKDGLFHCYIVLFVL